MKRLGLLLLLLGAACPARSPGKDQADPARPPTYELHRRRGELQIDGVLAESAWDAAARVSLVRSTDGRAATWPTEARLLWDDEHLYAAFQCSDRHVSSPFVKDDEPLYTSNVVELFLNPSGDLKRYFEIEVAPTGALFDASFTGPRLGMELAWSSNARRAVRIEGTLNQPDDVDRGWSVEVAIPFAALDGQRPRRGDVWRFNLFRLLQGPGQPNEGQAYSAPLTNDFHAVSRFAYLRFAD